MDVKTFAMNAALGAVGQIIRFALGVYKWASDPDRKDDFDWRVAASSLVMGGGAGIIGGLLPSSNPLVVLLSGYGGADAIEGLAAKFMPWAPVVLLGAVLLGAVGTPGAAIARDPTGKWATSPWHAWYEAQRQNAYPDGSAGGSCCGFADGYPYTGAYRINADGSADIFLHPEDPRVPPVHILAYMVLRYGKTAAGDNPTDAAVWWRTGPNLLAATYCFAEAPPKG